MSDAEVRGLVDHLFRHQAGRMVATLTRILGAHHLELAEEVVQDALLLALQRWPFHGVPANPSAWLIQAAKHRALDVLRRRALQDRRAPELAARLLADATAGDAAEPTVAAEIVDDQLRMMFMCCHPALAHDARVGLMLNVVAGFGAREVARAFLLDDATAAQRLVRAKRRLRELDVVFEMPAPDDVHDRLAAVLDTLYLLFNEGYSAHAGESPVRRELCAEAIRLARLLAEHPLVDRPEVHALLALMCLQAARLTARTDDAGELLLLPEQDRSQWDRALIARGFAHLDRSAAGDVVTSYHLQAAIASCHAAAPSFERTDWARILVLYDRLLALQPSPVVALNRAIALGMVHGPEAALGTARPLDGEPSLRRYALLPATLAELHRRAGDGELAREYFQRALTMECTDAERRFLRRRLEQVVGVGEAHVGERTTS
ncbi:MAG TPA: DUF6596 domain-containing protein [Gemmatimonadaceae bacterium]|nr:DUF6596 domain-containing protein [Gemmatimonadaceae bacterium]